MSSKLARRDRVAIAIFALLLPCLLRAADNDPPRQISQSGRGAYEASLVPMADGFAAAWYDTRHGLPEIYARRIDRQGRPSGPERGLTNGTDRAYEPAIAVVEDDLAVAWYERSPAATYRARVGVWTRDGERAWTRALSAATHDGRNPVVRTNAREVFCAWLEYAAGGNPDVWVQWFDLTGQPLVPSRRIAQTHSLIPAIRAAGDGFALVWNEFTPGPRGGHDSDGRSEIVFTLVR